MPEQPGQRFLLPVKLVVNRDGEWFHEGVKITHENTWKAFSKNLRLENGKLVVRIGFEWAEVEAEDAPLIVLAIREESENLALLLADGRNVVLEPETLTIGADHVPYCMVEGVQARFNRQAYYQLAQYICPAGSAEDFALTLPSGQIVPIRKAERL